VALSREEGLRWRELTRQLRRDRRLIAQLVRFLVVSGLRGDLAVARAGTAVPAITWLPATIAACLGLVLVGTGEYARTGWLVLTGVWVLITALLLAGSALVLIGTADWWQGRRERRERRERRPGPGSRR